ncbi:MAG: hypothetical protein R3C03_10245 [Pirellulaceae bacterium]
MARKSSKSKKRKTLVNRSNLLGGFDVGRLLTHPIVWFGIATIGLVLGANHVWKQIQFDFVPQEQHLLSQEKIHINEPNAWADMDAQFQLASFAEMNQASLLDPKLVSDVAEEISNWGPVEQVNEIRKSANGIDVTVRYRTPVAVVERESLSALLVDRNGVIVPGRYIESANGNQLEDQFGKTVSSDQTIFHIFVDNPNPNGLEPWAAWPDSRIRDAALCASQITNLFDQFNLRYIVHWPDIQNPGKWVYELWTPFGGKVIWSDSPESDSIEDIERKTQLVAEWVQENGDLDQLADWKKLDVRNGQAKLVSDAGKIASKRLLPRR